MKLAMPIVTLLAVALAACSGDRTDSATTSADTGGAGAINAPLIDDQPDEDVPPATAPMPRAQQDTLARFDGYAGVRFGMTADEVRHAWQQQYDSELGGAPRPDQVCYHLAPAGQSSPAIFALMIEDDRFVRYSVANDREVAPGGGKRGMSADEIRAVYAGRVEEQAHKYVVGGKYLRVADPSGGAALLIFESDADGAITEWRVGMPPQVEYVEGCS